MYVICISFAYPAYFPVLCVHFLSINVSKGQYKYASREEKGLKPPIFNRWARSVCVYLSFYQIFLLTILTFFPFSPFWRNIFSRSVIWVFSSTYLEERKGLVCWWQRHRIQIQIQQYLCQYCARAVKVFILECGETKQDRRGRGPRSIPDRYS